MDRATWPAALGAAGHLPVRMRMYGCKIDRVALSRVEHAVSRRFAATDVTVWTTCAVPRDRQFDAPTVEELLKLPDVRWFVPADEVVELDNVYFVVRSSAVKFVLEVVEDGVTAYADGDAEQIDSMVSELEMLLVKTRCRLALKSVPTRIVGCLGGGLVGVIGAVFTGLGVTDNSLASRWLMLAMVVMCAAGGWFLVDRLEQRRRVQLFWGEAVPKRWWSRWEPGTWISFGMLLVALVNATFAGVNVLSAPAKADGVTKSVVREVHPGDGRG